MKRFLCWFEASAGFTAIFLVLLFCFYAFPHKPETSIWEIATALGTIGAVVVALWIALYEQTRRREEDRSRAMLTAAGKMFHFLSVESAVRKVVARLQDDFEIGYGMHYGKCAAIIQSEGMWSIDDILPLVTLPNHAATHLAAARDQINHCVKLLSSADLNPTLSGTPKEKTFIHDMKSNLNTAAMSLRIAITECEQARFT